VLTDMDNWTEIRRRALVDGHSMRSVQKEFHLHWKTLRKILDRPEPPGSRQERPRAKPELGPFLPVLHQILEDDRKAPGKQRHTAKRVFERLRDEHGYQGGLTAVKDAGREGRREHTEVVAPLAHPPGDAQVDFGEAEVTLDGRPTEVALFVMALPHSDAIFCYAFPRECTEASLEGHARAFEFFGGVPRRISYDTLRIAGAGIAGGRGREVTGEFRRLRSHHLFEAHFCRVRRPNEKGHVETLVGYSRRNFLVPVPAVHGGLGPLNRRLAACCREEMGRRLRGKAATKGELLDAERASFIPLPAEAFAAHRVTPARASALPLVRFDTDDDSVPTAYAHRAVTVVAGVGDVRIVADDLTVARHPRDWGRHRVTYDPVHYPALLARTPGALDFAAPLEGWELPVCSGVLRRRLEAELGGPGTRQYIKVLRLLGRAGPGELTRAAQRAPERGVADADAVRLILEHRREQPVGLFGLAGRPHLKLVAGPMPDLAAYASLTAGVAPCRSSRPGARCS
jgi:transposase